MAIKKTLQIILIVIPAFALSGCLETIFAGSAGTAMEFSKDRQPGETVNDIKISAAIKAAFIKKGFRDLFAKINTEVVQGRVLYTGMVTKPEDAATAVAIAWDQQGVTEVINELKVDKKSNKFNLLQYTRDAMITSQIKSKIFMERNIKFTNYTVITMEDTVYLFGIARSEEELEKVAGIAANVHGVSKVVSHVHIQKMAAKSKPSTKPGDPNHVMHDDALIDSDLNDLSLDEGIGDEW